MFRDLLLIIWMIIHVVMSQKNMLVGWKHDTEGYWVGDIRYNKKFVFRRVEIICVEVSTL